MKYFIKYKEWVPKGGGTSHLEDKARFFNTDDIEIEWNNFSSMCRNRAILTDVTPLKE